MAGFLLQSWMESAAPDHIPKKISMKSRFWTNSQVSRSQVITLFTIILHKELDIDTFKR